MISAEHTFTIEKGITNVWDYVQDMRQWAVIFPGCRECEVINEYDSNWTIKVGVGGLVKTVNVLVHVERWAGPQEVSFSYKLDKEPVVGRGSYTAVATGQDATEVTLHVVVEGRGQMAPMWEAMCKPLMPQLAKAFAGELKSAIEGSKYSSREQKSSFGRRLSIKVRELWNKLVATKSDSEKG